jgi:hypothetical protein
MSIDEVVAALAAHDGGGTCGSEVWRALRRFATASTPTSRS